MRRATIGAGRAAPTAPTHPRTRRPRSDSTPNSSTTAVNTSSGAVLDQTANSNIFSPDDRNAGLRAAGIPHAQLTFALGTSNDALFTHHRSSIPVVAYTVRMALQAADSLAPTSSLRASAYRLGLHTVTRSTSRPAYSVAVVQKLPFLYADHGSDACVLVKAADSFLEETWTRVRELRGEPPRLLVWDMECFFGFLQGLRDGIGGYRIPVSPLQASSPPPQQQQVPVDGVVRGVAPVARMFSPVLERRSGTESGTAVRGGLAGTPRSSQNTQARDARARMLRSIQATLAIPAKRPFRSARQPVLRRRNADVRTSMDSEPLFRGPEPGSPFLEPDDDVGAGGDKSMSDMEMSGIDARSTVKGGGILPGLDRGANFLGSWSKADLSIMPLFKSGGSGGPGRDDDAEAIVDKDRTMDPTSVMDGERLKPPASLHENNTGDGASGLLAVRHTRSDALAEPAREKTLVDEHAQPPTLETDAPAVETCFMCLTAHECLLCPELFNLENTEAGNT